MAGLLADLCSAVDATRRAITCHMEREEADVLPLLQARLCASQQRDMVWRTLCAMPLRLLERVLPWLAGALRHSPRAPPIAGHKKLGVHLQMWSKLYRCAALNAVHSPLCSSHSWAQETGCSTTYVAQVVPTDPEHILHLIVLVKICIAETNCMDLSGCAKPYLLRCTPPEAPYGRGLNSLLLCTQHLSIQHRFAVSALLLVGDPCAHLCVHGLFLLR